MTAGEFRKIALSFAGAAESSHQGHPDFRVRGRVFATLGYPDDEHAMVKLSPADQARYVKRLPDTFHAAKGAWGKAGSTLIKLAAAPEAEVRRAAELAWSCASGRV